MSYAFVLNNTIVKADVPLPPSALRLADGVMVNLRTASGNDRRACGYYEIVEVAQPALQPNQRADRTVAMVSGQPTEAWTVRAETAEEAEARVRASNRLSMSDVQAAEAHLAALDAYTAWYNSAPVQTIVNGTGNMDAATLSSAIRKLAPQVAALTVGQARLIRVLFGGQLLDSTD